MSYVNIDPTTFLDRRITKHGKVKFFVLKILWISHEMYYGYDQESAAGQVYPK